MRKVYRYCVKSTLLAQDLRHRAQLCDGRSLSSQCRKKWLHSTTYDELAQNYCFGHGRRFSRTVSPRRLAFVRRKFEHASRQYLHLSIPRQGPPRPPAIRPALGGGVAPRISSVTKHGFSDDDFSIRSEKEAADKAAEKARLEREKKVEAAAIKRRDAYERSLFRKKADSLMRELRSVESAAREIRASIPLVLRQARELGKQALKNTRAWRKYQHRDIVPLKRRLDTIKHELAELEKKIMYTLSMIEYNTKWWIWRRESLAQQAREAWLAETKMKMDEEDYNRTLHGQSRYLAYALVKAHVPIARSLKVFTKSESFPKLSARSRFALKNLERHFLLHTGAGSSGYLDSGVRTVLRMAHTYRELTRVALATARLPEVSYEFWFPELNVLVDKLRTGYVDISLHVNAYREEFSSFHRIHSHMSQYHFHTWNARPLRDDIGKLLGSLAFHNPALNSHFGTDLIALLRPWNVVSNGTAILLAQVRKWQEKIDISREPMTVAEELAYNAMTVYNSATISLARANHDQKRLLKFRLAESLLRFAEPDKPWTRELLNRQAMYLRAIKADRKVMHIRPRAKADKGVDAAEEMLAAWEDDSQHSLSFSTESQAVESYRSVAPETRPSKIAKLHEFKKLSPKIKTLKKKQEQLRLRQLRIREQEKLEKARLKNQRLNLDKKTEQERFRVRRLNSKGPAMFGVNFQSGSESTPKPLFFHDTSMIKSKDSSLNKAEIASFEPPSQDAESTKIKTPAPNQETPNRTTYKTRKARRLTFRKIKPKMALTGNRDPEMTPFQRYLVGERTRNEHRSGSDFAEASSHQSTDDLAVADNLLKGIE